MKDQECPPCQFIVIPSEEKCVEIVWPSLADRDPYASDGALEAESSFTVSEISGSSETIPLVVIKPVNNSTCNQFRDDEEDDASLESISGDPCDFRGPFCDSYFTLSTKGTMCFWSDHDHDYTEGSFDSHYDDGVQEAVVDLSPERSTPALERQDNTLRSPSMLEAFERRDDSYFTEGFINVGDLPFVC